MEYPTRTPVPDSRSSSREYPKKPFIIDRTNRVTPTTQLISRGRRKAPVKNTRHMCTTRAAMKTRAAQWCIWRMTRPARTSKLMSSDEA